MSLYRQTLVQQRKMLQNLDLWLDKAVAHCVRFDRDGRKFDANSLLTARLAADQFPLTRQIQIACDNAKMTAARLTGKTAPAHPDTETTLGELKTRIAAVVEHLGTYTEADYNGAADRLLELPVAPGMAIRGDDYATEMALPNFYFHASTAYNILRHNGVELGKKDFLGPMAFSPKG